MTMRSWAVLGVIGFVASWTGCAQDSDSRADGQTELRNARISTAGDKLQIDGESDDGPISVVAESVTIGDLSGATSELTASSDLDKGRRCFICVLTEETGELNCGEYRCMTR